MGQKLDRHQAQGISEGHANGHETSAKTAPAPRVEDWPEEAVQRLWRAIWADAPLGFTDSDNDPRRPE